MDRKKATELLIKFIDKSKKFKNSLLEKFFPWIGKVFQNYHDKQIEKFLQEKEKKPNFFQKIKNIFNNAEIIANEKIQEKTNSIDEYYSLREKIYEKTLERNMRNKLYFKLISLLALNIIVPLFIFHYIDKTSDSLTILGILFSIEVGTISIWIASKAQKSQIFWNLQSRINEIYTEISKLSIEKKSSYISFLIQGHPGYSLEHYEKKTSMFFKLSVLQGFDKEKLTYSRLIMELEKISEALYFQKLIKPNKEFLNTKLASLGALIQYGSLAYAETFKTISQLSYIYELLPNMHLLKGIVKPTINEIYLQPHENFIRVLEARINYFENLFKQKINILATKEELKRFYEILFYYKNAYGASEDWIKNSDTKDIKKQIQELNKKLDSISKRTASLLKNYGVNEEHFISSIMQQINS